MKTEPKGPSLLKQLDQYWFGHGSPTALGLFRILIGFIGFLNCVMLLLHWDSWFSETGYVPAWISQMWLPPHVPLLSDKSPELHVARLNIFNGVTQPWLFLTLYLTLTLASLTTSLGLWTRASTIIMAIGTVSLQHRNAIILHGGDSVLRICAVYLAVAPCGKACSLDRLFAIWKGKISAGPVQVSLWPQRLVCYNVALIYFTTVWMKYFGSYWREGLATYFPARLPEFYRFPVPAFFNDLPFVKITTYGTLFVEFAMATLVFFRPLRKYALLGGLLLHGFIEYSMNIPLFSFLMCSMYICFFDGEEITAWAKRTGNRLAKWKTTVRYPRETQLRPAAAGFLSAVDAFQMVKYERSPSDAWEGERANGTKMPYAVASWSRSLGALAFAWIPGLWHKVLHASLEPAEIVEVAPEPTTPEEPKRKKTKKGR